MTKHQKKGLIISQLFIFGCAATARFGLELGLSYGLFLYCF